MLTTDSPVDASTVAVKTHRFALAISGGIALGAYEAGVLIQLYRDIRVFNERVTGARLVIDAIAGSSAGSITGLILAQALALNVAPEEFEKRMRACWITEPDILNLLQPKDDQAEALLTDAATQKVAATTGELNPQGNQVPNKDNVIALWMTLTNLDGIPYSISFERPGAPQVCINLYALDYRDYAPFFISGPQVRYVSIPIENLTPDAAESADAGDPAWWNACRKSSWQEARDCATISGAFPVAFQTRPLKRDLRLYRHYQDFKKEAQAREPQRQFVDEATFTCVDGGIFTNQPIGKAIDAVAYLNRLDPSRDVDGQRTYLIIEPDPNSPDSIGKLLAPESPVPGPHGVNPGAALAKLVSAYFNDALYADFTQVAKTNRQIRDLNKVLAECGLSDSQKEQIKKAVGLDYKREITIERIPCGIPAKDRLAGEFAGHFGGILQQNLREADLETGRREAHEWIRDWLSLHAGEFGLDPADLTFNGQSCVDSAPPQLTKANEALIGMSWDKLQAASRTDILVAGANRLDALLGRWLPPAKPYLPAVRVLFRGKVRQIFASGPASGLDWTGAIAALRSTGAPVPLLARPVVAGVSAVRGVLNWFRRSKD